MSDRPSRFLMFARLLNEINGSGSGLSDEQYADIESSSGLTRSQIDDVLREAGDVVECEGILSFTPKTADWQVKNELDAVTCVINRNSGVKITIDPTMDRDIRMRIAREFALVLNTDGSIC